MNNIIVVIYIYIIPGRSQAGTASSYNKKGKGDK